jgi:RNA polymerase sigma factor (TIGR02999 family)
MKPEPQSPKTEPVTALLRRYQAGDSSALEELLPLVYDELRGLARMHRARVGADGLKAPGTISLVHEAYLRLVDQRHVDWQSRAQFYCLASRAMRSVLVDRARWHRRQKRGGGWRKVELEDELVISRERAVEVVALDGALERLLGRDERLGRIVECRFFGGLTVDQTADALGVSPATVKRGWNVARSWLYDELRA